MAHSALLIIDYTNDFVAPDGALTAGKPAQDIAERVTFLVNDFLTNGQYVILPTDLHEVNDPFHPETKLFPPHNLKNSWGREFYGPLQDWYESNQNNQQVYFYDKNRYSAFANSNLDNYLRERQITDLHLVGVCTDICVLHTAVDAYRLNYQITIHQDAVATFTENGQEWALAHFKNSLGATIM